MVNIAVLPVYLNETVSCYYGFFLLCRTDFANIIYR
jgi:hypothetical protein